MRIFTHLLGLIVLSTLALGAQELRLIRHAMGETYVPASPKRIIVLDGGAVDATVVLGFMPVGAVNVFASGLIPDYLKTYYTDTVTTQSVGTLAEPSLEKILLLKPDLILSTTGRSKGNYKQLSGIAPTVLAGDEGGYRWKEWFLLYGQALGKEKEAREQLATYENRSQLLQKKLEKLGTMPTISVVRFFLTETRLYPARTFIGTILSDAGLKRPKDQAILRDKQVVGVEAIPGMDADYLFYTFLSDPMGAGRDSKENYPAFFGSPLWKNMKASKNNHVFEATDEYWMRGTGLGSALLVLGDLERHLLEG